MASDILLDTSSPIITINQATLMFKINKQSLSSQSYENKNNSLFPISQTEIFITNITSNYVAYRARITRKKFYTVEPSHLVISPNSSIKVRIIFFYNPNGQFPPEGHKFRFEGVIIPNNMKYKDTREIFEELSTNKREVKGNSIRKIVEFIYDNNYFYDSSSENIKLDSTQNLGNSISSFNPNESVYTNALGKSTERPSRLSLRNPNRSNKLRGQRKEEVMDPIKLKEECESLQNDYDKYEKELNDVRQKINNISSKNKFRYIVPKVNFSSVNNKMIIILFCTSFFLGFYLTK